MSDDNKKVVLMPCPFCGCPANQPEKEKHDTGVHRPVWSITCSLYCVSMKRKSKASVIFDWNTRCVKGI